MVTRFGQALLFAVIATVFFFIGSTCNKEKGQAPVQTRITKKHYEGAPVATPFTVDTLAGNSKSDTGVSYISHSSRRTPIGVVDVEVTAPCVPDTIKIGYQLQTSDTCDLPSIPPPTGPAVRVGLGLLAGPGVAAPGLTLHFRSQLSAGVYYDPFRRQTLFNINVPLFIKSRTVPRKP